MSPDEDHGCYGLHQSQHEEDVAERYEPPDIPLHDNPEHRIAALTDAAGVHPHYHGTTDGDKKGQDFEKQLHVTWISPAKIQFFRACGNQA